MGTRIGSGFAKEFARMRRPATRVVMLALGMLSACTSAKDVLEPSAIAPTEQSAALSQAEGTASVTPLATTDAGASNPTAAISSKTRLQFAPIVGATVNAATPLTERLGLRARERGITLTGSTDTTPATIILRGYFSAMSEGKDTTVVYVWDVYDPAGNRLHRINGLQKAPSVTGGDDWSAVSPSTMQAIADTTIDQIASWLATQAG